MPTINEQVVLACSKASLFSQIVSVDFMKLLDPNFGRHTTILFHNERLMRSISKVEPIGDVEIERIAIPETFTVTIQLFSRQLVKVRFLSKV